MEINSHSTLKKTTMTRYVPFEPDYDIVRKLEKASMFLLILSAILILANLIISKLFNNESTNCCATIMEAVQICSYVTMSCYLIVEFCIKYRFFEAESKTRQDLIDNSFATKYSVENTEGYYNNTEIKAGIKRLALNTYESSFHTANTLKIMARNSIIAIIPIIIIFLISIFSKNGSGVIRTMVEISLPVFLLYQLMHLCKYLNRVRETNKQFKSILTDAKCDELTNKETSKLLYQVLEYHSIKAWANINLDSKIFNKHNEAISKKWNREKENLQ